MGKGSQINPLLTLEYMQAESENKYFDRKSSRIRPVDLADPISAFANADGGTIVIGINDKKRELEGINSCGEEKINDFINAPKDYCRPMPRYREEFVNIINSDGYQDRLLLLHIEASVNQVIRTTSERTFLRIGDRSKEMLGDNLRNLEYAKGARHFEDEINQYANLEDLDEDLLLAYKKHIDAENLDTYHVLSARGFIQKHDGGECLTNAAVLLFAKDIMKFYPNCRVRFIRIDGLEMGVGSKLNVVKDKSIDLPILRIIEATKAFIATQLRVFVSQDVETGKFKEVKEYPEFPWLEGIVNAVAHRDYAMTGAYIKIMMFDDRLEIESPGCLPDVVTVDNIKETRFSRNPKISRVLTEFGWVRELNEGVKKIYADMQNAQLAIPEYSDHTNFVKLVLRNNIAARNIVSSDRSKPQLTNSEALNADLLKNKSAQLTEIQLKILYYIGEAGAASREEIEQYTQKGLSTVKRNLKQLRELDLVDYLDKKRGAGVKYVLKK